MFQKFYDTSQLSRFVKHLLSTEPIPILQTVTDDTILTEGCSYIYCNNVIRCTSWGRIKKRPNDSAEAKIEYVNSVPETTTYVSKLSWYDSETHKYLGNYLRYLRDSRSVDLMRYYNCYNSTELTDIYLSRSQTTDVLKNSDASKVSSYSSSNSCSYNFGTITDYRVLAVPIRFDTQYTIALDCHESIYMRGIVYNSRSGMIGIQGSESEYYSDYLEHSFRVVPRAQFNKPFSYTLSLATNDIDIPKEIKSQLKERQCDLYLLLQIPKSTSSSIVVLEGDYTKNFNYVQICNPGYFGKDRNTDYSYTNIHLNSLSLLNYNTGESYAFSDRLTEYLMLNVVTPLETLPTNILRVQASLNSLSSRYKNQLLTKKSILGMWDDDIQLHVKDIIYNNSDNLVFPFDHDGYINKDVEHLLSLKGVYST